MVYSRYKQSKQRNKPAQPPVKLGKVRLKLSPLHLLTLANMEKTIKLIEYDGDVQDCLKLGP